MVRIYSIIIFGSFRYDFWFATKLHVIWCCRYDWNSNMIYHSSWNWLWGERKKLKVPQKNNIDVQKRCLHIRMETRPNIICVSFSHWEYAKTLDETCNIVFLRIVMPMIRWCNVANSTILSLAFNVLSASGSSKVVVLLVARFLGEYIENVLLSK